MKLDVSAIDDAIRESETLIQSLDMKNKNRLPEVRMTP